MFVREVEDPSARLGRVTSPGLRRSVVASIRRLGDCPGGDNPYGSPSAEPTVLFFLGPVDDEFGFLP